MREEKGERLLSVERERDEALARCGAMEAAFDAFVKLASRDGAWAIPPENQTAADRLVAMVRDDPGRVLTAHVAAAIKAVLLELDAREARMEHPDTGLRLTIGLMVAELNRQILPPGLPPKRTA